MFYIFIMYIIVSSLVTILKKQRRKNVLYNNCICIVSLWIGIHNPSQNSDFGMYCQLKRIFINRRIVCYPDFIINDWLYCPTKVQRHLDGGLLFLTFTIRLFIWIIRTTNTNRLRSFVRWLYAFFLDYGWANAVVYSCT